MCPCRMSLILIAELFLNFARANPAMLVKPLTLSTLEFRMLNLFCQNRNRVLTRKAVVGKNMGPATEKLCGRAYVNDNVLSRIRGKIETDGTVYIKTVYGMGYKCTGGETA